MAPKAVKDEAAAVVDLLEADEKDINIDQDANDEKNEEFCETTDTCILFAWI